jgi:hypothetical protein
MSARLTSVSAALVLAAAPTAAAAPTFQATFVLALAVPATETADTTAADEAWLDGEIAEAERLYAPLGVHFKRGPRRPLAPARARPETREDRDALAHEGLVRGCINVFVVDSLRDVDDPKRLRQGVHWHAPDPAGAHYVILSRIANPTVLAHELGHFFGNAHTTTTDNLMSYDRATDRTFIDERQARRIVARARAYLRTKELAPG